MSEELMWALKNGQLEEIEKALVTPEDVNRRLEGGRHPLHIAADYGHAEVLNYLISRGANVNAEDKFHISPLLYATFEGHVSCVKILLDKGANKDYKPPGGVTAFEAAETDALKALLK